MHQLHSGRATMFGLEKHAVLYERFAFVLARPLYARVAADVAEAAIPDNGHVLDIGTGPGMVPLRVAAIRPELSLDAVDLAPDMIARAQRSAADSGRPDAVRFAVGDVADLPFPDGTFDLVVSTISQHHWDDPEAGCREIDRVLRPGAEAWIYDFRWALNRADTAARAVSTTPTLTRQSPLIGASRLSPIGRLVLRKRENPVSR